MKSPNYYRTRTIVRAVFVLGVLFAFYLISTRIWWTGTGFCFNTIEICGV